MQTLQRTIQRQAIVVIVGLDFPCRLHHAIDAEPFGDGKEGRDLGAVPRPGEPPRGDAQGHHHEEHQVSAVTASQSESTNSEFLPDDQLDPYFNIGTGFNDLPQFAYYKPEQIHTEDMKVDLDNLDQAFDLSHNTPQEISAIRTLVTKHRDLFTTSKNAYKTIHNYQVDVQVKKGTPLPHFQKPYRISSYMHEKLVEISHQNQKLGKWILYNDIQITSPVFVLYRNSESLELAHALSNAQKRLKALKMNKNVTDRELQNAENELATAEKKAKQIRYRLLTDLRFLNEQVRQKLSGYLVPYYDIHDIGDFLSERQITSSFDICNLFESFILSERSLRYAGLSFFNGPSLVTTVAPPGLISIPAFSQFVLSQTFSHAIKKNMRYFIDDFLCATKAERTPEGSIQHHVDYLDAFFTEFSKLNLMFSTSKCSFF